jgi:hypothetical protein
MKAMAVAARAKRLSWLWQDLPPLPMLNDAQQATTCNSAIGFTVPLSAAMASTRKHIN